MVDVFAEGEAVGGVVDADLDAEQFGSERDCVLKLELVGSDLVLFQFDLQCIAFGDKAGIESYLDSSGERVEKGKGGLDCCDFVLQPEDEEVGRFDVFEDIAFADLCLQFGCFYSEGRKPMSVDEASSGEDGLHSSSAEEQSVSHKAYLVGQVGFCLDEVIECLEYSSGIC